MSEVWLAWRWYGHFSPGGSPLLGAYRTEVSAWQACERDAGRPMEGEDEIDYRVQRVAVQA